MSDSTAQLETGQGVVTTLTDAYLAGRTDAYLAGRTDILAELARKQAPACSEVTRQLIERDAKGRAKYGTSLDRTDLDLPAWLQHMAEELLDAAGYALAAKREAGAGERVVRLGDAWKFARSGGSFNELEAMAFRVPEYALARADQPT